MSFLDKAKKKAEEAAKKAGEAAHKVGDKGVEEAKESCKESKGKIDVSTCYFFATRFHRLPLFLISFYLRFIDIKVREANIILVIIPNR